MPRVIHQFTQVFVNIHIHPVINPSILSIARPLIHTPSHSSYPFFHPSMYPPTYSFILNPYFWSSSMLGKAGHPGMNQIRTPPLRSSQRQGMGIGISHTVLLLSHS